LIKNLNNLHDKKGDIKKQIEEKQKKIKKIALYIRMSKFITIAGSALSFISSTISGGLSLTGNSQEGVILSFAGSATSGLFTLAASVTKKKNSKIIKQNWRKL
jgi:hypothetical protein